MSIFAAQMSGGKAYESAVKGIEGIEDIWMIGDSLSADFEGPRKAGWKSILVRQRASVTPSFDTLEEVVGFLNQQPNKRAHGIS